MAKFLRVLIIVLLLLSAAALALGVMLFNRREQLKGQTRQYVRDILRLSAHIEAEQADELTQKDLPRMDAKMKERESELLTYVFVDPATGEKRAEGPGTMAQAMNEIIAAAQIQQGRLDDVRDALKQNREELATSEKKVQDLEGKVTSLEGNVSELETKVGVLNQEVKQKGEQISALQEKNVDLEGQVQDKEDEIAKIKDEKLDLEDKNRQLEDLIAKLREREGTASTNTTGQMKAAPGLKGKVVLVNPQWNFVLFALAPDSGVTEGVHLLVQRDAAFVGKVRVAYVNEAYMLAIADIVSDMQQLPFEVGDYVFY